MSGVGDGDGDGPASDGTGGRSAARSGGDPIRSDRVPARSSGLRSTRGRGEAGRGVWPPARTKATSRAHAPSTEEARRGAGGRGTGPLAMLPAHSRTAAAAGEHTRTPLRALVFSRLSARVGERDAVPSRPAAASADGSSAPALRSPDWHVIVRCGLASSYSARGGRGWVPRSPAGGGGGFEFTYVAAGERDGG